MTRFSAVDRGMMEEALREALACLESDDVPVGCVISLDGRIVGRGRNRREKNQDALAHAETEAIRDACRHLGRWRLHDCTLYVSLEPCLMCAGAIINARLARVVYGADDAKAGAAGGFCDIYRLPWNHRPLVSGGLLAEEAAKILREFFAARRALERTHGSRGQRRRFAESGSGGAPEKEDAAPRDALR